MDRYCKNCNSHFCIDDVDLAFYAKVSPVFAGKRFDIPPPTLCPNCRLQRRIAYRNQIHVFPRKSSASGTTIFSNFPENAPFPVYSREEWWGDAWDPMIYGRDFDFSQPLFLQLKKLRNEVPHVAVTAGINWENSEYCNNASDIKNCYLVFNTAFGEDCMYCENVYGSRDCIDCTYTTESELCYDCVLCSRCYNVQSSWQSEDCFDSFFLLNCRSCRSCFGCTNLRQKQYCVFNEQYSKAQYEEFVQQLKLNSDSVRKDLAERVYRFWQEHPRPHVITRHAEGVSGNYIFHSRDVRDSYFIRDGENLRYCFNVQEGAKDCYDYSFPGIGVELFYECSVCPINSFNLQFCYLCGNGSSDLRYCCVCFSCQDCFACVGLKRKQFCILNKQYSEEQYHELLPRAIEHMRATEEWGEFFPLSFAPIPYNISLAQRYFPLSKEEIDEKGLSWYDKHLVDASGAIEAIALPDELPDTDEPITVKSMVSDAPYRITREEIHRYQSLSVPLPRTTYIERMAARAEKFGGIRLYKHICRKTGKAILSTYPPDSPWIIWDKDVYEQEFS